MENDDVDIIDYAREIIYTGFLEEEIQEGAFLFGKEIEHNTTIEDKNWLPYFSYGEMQYGTYYDTMSCVTFSALNVVETKLNYMYKHGMISDENIAWCKEKGYINERDEFDLADRFNAALSGTTEDGNYGYKVWKSIDKDGVVPEAMCAWDRSRNAVMEERYGDWFRDPANVTQEAKDLGQEFLKRFDIQYESVEITEDRVELFDALKHSPVQVFISTRCPYDENNVEQRCGYGANHAVTLCDDTDPRGYLPLFDHYVWDKTKTDQEQFIRKVASNYKIHPYGYSCNIVDLTIKNMPQNNFVRVVKDADSPAVGFFLPAYSPETIENMARLYGKEVPKNKDGSFDWDQFIEGSVKLEVPLNE